MTAKQASRKKDETKRNPGFEKSMERLETIVGQMEDGSLNLEDMISRFEEGQALIKFCTGKLNEVERKIEVLVKKDGKTAVEPLDAVTSEDDAPQAEPEQVEEELF